MADPDDDLGSRRGQITPADRDAIRNRASSLGDKIAGAKAKWEPPASETARKGESYGQAFKMAIELVVGVVVGGGIGWALDSVLGSKPWLMIVFFFLGFAGGLLNVVRAAQRLQRKAELAQRASPAVKDDDELDR